MTGTDSEADNITSKFMFSTHNSNFLSFDPRSKISKEMISEEDESANHLFIGEDVDDSYDYSEE